MKKLLIFLLMSLQCLAIETGSAQELPVEEDEIIVLWDLGGIHFDLSKVWFAIETVKKMGLLNIVSTALFDQKVPSKSFIFGTLEKFPLKAPAGFECTCDTTGTQLPYIICAQQAGTISEDEIKKMARELLPELRLKGHFVSQRHQELAQGSVETIFDPRVHADLTALLPQGIEILKKIDALKKAGRKIKNVGFTNWPPAAWKLVAERFPEVVALFDDIIVSGHIKTIKPNKAAFDAVFERHGHDRNKYIYIDDQKENVEAGKAFGIENSILFIRGDYYTLEKQLYALGVLSSMPTQRILTKNVKIATALVVAGVALLWWAK